MKEKYMKDFNGEKIFSLEYDKETLKDMVLDKQEEIERLHSIIKEVREYMKSIEHEPDADMYIELGQYKEYKHILEILDKVEENK